MVKINKQLVSNHIISTRTHGTGNTREFIAIHETANTNHGADAQAHSNLQANGNRREASWHYQVDDKGVIQSFNDNVRCWHVGNSNNKAIAIEICVNSDGNYSKAVDNAVALTKVLMARHSIPISKVKQHNYFTGKNCPTNLRNGSKGITWAQFKAKLSGKTGKPKSSSKPTGSKRIRTIQSTLNSRYDTKIKVDGFNGAQTKRAIIKGYQIELNRQFNANLVVDGIWGTKSRNASVTVRRGAEGRITWLIQARLYCLGYDPKGLDSIFGGGLHTAVRKFQSDNKIGVDGIVGKGTFGKLFG